MKDYEVAAIIAKSLREPSHAVIKASQKDCGYSADGFNVKNLNIQKCDKGSVYRPLESEGYPTVTHQYLKALYCFPN